MNHPPRTSRIALATGAGLLAASLASAQPVADAPGQTADPFRVLIFTRTAGFRHDSIPAGIECLRSLGPQSGYTAVASEDPELFTDDGLAAFRVVVFLNTTGDVLTDAQQAAFERFIQRGRGFVGIHAASDTEYDWPWYGQLVGAYFKGHPHVQPAEIQVVSTDHPATHHLAARWTRTDEWYDFREPPPPTVRRLLMIDETTYEGGMMGEDHPVAWCHEFDGGRAIYTAGGHTSEAFAEPDFKTHLAGCIRWAAGRQAHSQ